jgi:methionine-rich copper-binding protein CopC
MVAAVVLPQSPARAHAILVESRPASGATIPAGHVALRLRYNSRIDAERSRLTLTRPDGTTVVLPIGDAPTPDLLVSDADLPPGAYSVRWQVLATDGHITRGDVPFTLVAPKAAP